MASEYSLTDVLERLYHNQLALEAAVMELTCGQNDKTLQSWARPCEGRFTQLAKTQVISSKAWLDRRDWASCNRQLSAKNGLSGLAAAYHSFGEK